MTDAELIAARKATLGLIAARADDATVCPSEAARLLAKGNGEPSQWRPMMPLVHAAVDQLLAEGLVEASWKGKRLGARKGPYRLRTHRPGREAADEQ